MTTIHLTDDELHTIVHALRVAADRFDLDAGTCRSIPNQTQLVEQFERQADDARKLATALEEM